MISLHVATTLTDLTGASAQLLRTTWAHDRGWLTFILVTSASAYAYALVVCQTRGTGALRLHASSLTPGGLLDLFEGPHMLVLVQVPLPLIAALWGDRLSHSWLVGLTLCALGVLVLVRGLLTRLRPYLAAFLLLTGLALIRPLAAGLAGAALLAAAVPYEAGLWMALRERLTPSEAAGHEIHAVLTVMLAGAGLSVIAVLSPVVFVLLFFGLLITKRLLDRFSSLGEVLDKSLRDFAQSAADAGVRWPYRWLIARSLPEGVASC